MVRPCGRDFLSFLALVLLCFFATNGQTPAPTPVTPIRANAPGEPDKHIAIKQKISRWFEFEQLSAATRYHFIENDNKTIAANNHQYLFTAKMRFKFDSKGRYSVAANLSTGRTFLTSWNSSGWGSGNFQKPFNARQLYFDAKPTNGVEIQLGGLYINRGENTEAVTYDNDGYITGERVQLRFPKKLYFDEISVTYARLADVTVPNVFSRFKRFDKQNYHQFLVRKQINKSVGFSADYSFESGRDTFHQAVKIKLPEKKIIDAFLFEQYERVDPDRSYGYNVFAGKQLNKILNLSGGFADINIRALNSDRFPPGKRLYFTDLITLNPEFSISIQFTQGVGMIAPNIPRSRLDIVLNYNILETLKRTRFF